jgi:hypothetical protein
MVSGGQGVTEFSPDLNTTTTYYAQARDNNTGCVSATRLPVTSTVFLTPEITTQPASTVICSGSTAVLTVAATNATAYQWKKDGYDVSDGDGGQSATYTTAPLTDNATYSVVVTNGIAACSTTSDNAVVTVNDLPTVSTSNPARCGEGDVTLTAIAGGSTTTAMTYTWIVGNGAAQTTTTGSLPLSSVVVGSTAYSVTVTNENGCTSAADAGTITVHGLPAITLASASSSTAQTVTAGDAVADIQYTTANATGANISGTPTGVSGTWSSNVHTISGTPTSSGTFNYTVTTTNGNGCTDASATGKIIVTLPPPITYNRLYHSHDCIGRSRFYQQCYIQPLRANHFITGNGYLL